MERARFMRDLSERLAEVPEAEARDDVADLYSDIRRVTGVPTVALVYRALAVDPGSLAAIWSSLAPNLADERVRAAATRLATADPATSPVPAVLVSVDRAAAAVTLASFDRANRLNLVGLTAFLDGVRAPRAAEPAAAARDVLVGGLPMADLGSLPSNTIALLEEMSRPVTGGALPVLIPSVFRFFAHDHALLEALWQAIRPIVTSETLSVSAAELRTAARGIAEAFPYAVPQASVPQRQIVERFVDTIPPMIVVTELLRNALGPHP